MAGRPPIVWKRVITDAIAYAAFSISAFGLFVTILENYVVNEPSPHPWFDSAVGALWNFYFAVLRPLFPRELFLVFPNLDVYAITYFPLLILSLAVLNRRRGKWEALRWCSLFGSSIVVVYEIGLYLVSPAYLNLHATNFQVQLGLGWITNADLLEVSMFVVLVVCLSKFDLRKLLRNRAPHATES